MKGKTMTGREFLASRLTARQHQTIIDGLTEQIKGWYSDRPDSYYQKTLRSIEWHAEQYILKTGELPE